MMVPHRFYFCLALIGTINKNELIEPDSWPGFIDYDWIENKLRPLESEDLKTLCTGHPEESDPLVLKHDLALVCGLLSLIFDGEINSYFFKNET
jgi:hypothetical protein